MKVEILRNKPVLVTVTAVTALALAGILVARATRADNGINVQNFVPASGSGYVFTENGAPEVPIEAAGGSYRRYNFGINYNYLDSPFVQTDPSGNTRTATIVNGIQTMDLMTGIEWNGRFSLNLDLPLDQVDMPGSATMFAPGDLRLFPKLYLFDHSAPVQLALVPEIWFPTGNASLFTTNGGGYGLLVAAEKDLGFLSIAANAGYRNFPNALYQTIDFRQMVPVALGLNIPVVRGFGVNLEGASELALPFNSSSSNPSDLYAGLNWKIAQGVTATGGGGLDTFNPAQSGNFRVQVGLRLAPVSIDADPAPAIAPLAKIEPAPAAPAPAPPVTRVIYTPKWIYVRDEILFENNSAKILPPGKALLDEVAQVLKDNRRHYKSIVIEGHGNEIGSDAFNLTLSQRRADAVKKYLVSKGTPRKALKTIGFGKRRPKVTQASGVSRDMRLVLNRRVQFRVIH